MWIDDFFRVMGWLMGKHSVGGAAHPTTSEETRVLSAVEVNASLSEGRKQRRHSQSSHRAIAHPRKYARSARFIKAFTASTMVSAGITTLGVGMVGGVAQAAQPLSSSIVGGASTQTTAPAALQGSANASVKSQVSETKAQSEADPVTQSCAVTGAQGVRSAFLTDSSQLVVMPLASGTYTVTSPFGYRTSPIDGEYSFHAGVDMAADLNEPIHAIADGTVTYAGVGIDGRSSNIIIIEHTINGKTYESWYIHMYDDGVLVSVGDKVTAGQVIGLVGSNGNSTGPHLHLEIHDPSRGSSNETDELISPLTFLSSLNAKDPTDICG